MILKKISRRQKSMKNFPGGKELRTTEILLALKAPITTAADNKFWNIFPNFRKK